MSRIDWDDVAFDLQIIMNKKKRFKTLSFGVPKKKSK